LAQPVTMVDPRQPRLGQGITGAAALVGFLLDVPAVLPALAAILAAASLFGARANPYAWLFRALRRTGAMGPPRELEEAAPPRFANTVGFVVLSLATVARYGFELESVAWGLALVVSALALLAAVTGLCVGCELYVWGRRVATGGRVRGRLVRPVEETGAPG
jgi:Domain of unknown function (DUF4395)